MFIVGCGCLPASNCEDVGIYPEGGTLSARRPVDFCPRFQGQQSRYSGSLAKFWKYLYWNFIIIREMSTLPNCVSLFFASSQALWLRLTLYNSHRNHSTFASTSHNLAACWGQGIRRHGSGELTFHGLGWSTSGATFKISQLNCFKQRCLYLT